MRQCSPPPVCNVSHVICSMSHVMCHMSQVLYILFFLLFFFFEVLDLVRVVFYHRGLIRLVFQPSVIRYRRLHSLADGLLNLLTRDKDIKILFLFQNIPLFCQTRRIGYTAKIYISVLENQRTVYSGGGTRGRVINQRSYPI